MFFSEVFKMMDLTTKICQFHVHEIYKAWFADKSVTNRTGRLIWTLLWLIKNRQIRLHLKITIKRISRRNLWYQHWFPTGNSIWILKHSFSCQWWRPIITLNVQSWTQNIFRIKSHMHICVFILSASKLVHPLCHMIRNLEMYYVET